MYTVNDFFVSSEIKKTTWFLTFGCSTFGHILFFAIIFFFPNLDQGRLITPTVIDIDLVSITEKVTDESKPEPIEDQSFDMAETVKPLEPVEQISPQRIKPPETKYESNKYQPLAPIEPPKTITPLKPKPEIVKPPPEPEKKEIKPIEAPESPATPALPKIKRSLKKQTIKKDQVAQNKKQKHLSDTLQRLKNQVRINETHQRIRSNGRVAKSSVKLMDIYNAEVSTLIQKNWALSSQLIHYQSDLKVRIRITIMRNGFIKSTIFEKKSGDKYYDESIRKAVKKSNPLPPLPNAFLGPFHTVGFNFRLSDLK
ncbi:hypothetical protein MHK_002944 [Candidatus Magnetomorum sp. HK-1]|nr:hypothetical protein MHK_002944 [Candidatus Magnetomorum sp. HK-1]